MICFILNQQGIKKNFTKVKKEIINYMDNKNIKFKIKLTKYKNHATKLATDAIAEGFKTIISVGGDGTILETATALSYKNINFGIIPLGTGNDFARSIGVNEYSIKKALDVITNGKTVKVDMISVNGVNYLNISSIGIDAQIAKDTNHLKNYFKSLSYYVSTVINVCRFKGINSKIIIDGRKELNGLFTLVAVCNGKYYGGGFKIAPNATINSGYINLVTLERISNLKMFLLFYLVFIGKHDLIKQTSFHQCKHVEIYLNQSNIVNIDGNIYNIHKKLEYKILEKAIDILVP